MKILFANLLLTALAWVFLQGDCRLATAQDSTQDSAVVEEYLNRLELDSILIEHLQRQLDGTAVRSEKVVIARQLAGLYSKTVFSETNPFNVESHLERINELATQFPEVDSPELKMTLLHSEYAGVEKEMIAWLTSSRSPSERTDLRTELLDLGRRTKIELNRLENSILEGSNSQLFLRASYIYGWICYYRGLVETEERVTWMKRADESFRDFLELETTRPVSQFSAQWFNLQSPWHARAMVGMGMALRALGEDEESKFCFKILESVEADANVRRNLDVWRLSSYLYLQQMDQAFAFLRRRAASSRADDQKRTRLWVAAIDAASSASRGKGSKRRVQFLRFGLHGLLADMNAPVLREVVEQNELNLAGEDFLLAWCRGYLDFYRAEQTRDEDDYLSAKRELNWALKSANSEVDKVDMAKCRFLLGWIDFQLNEFESASQLFQQAIPELVERNVALASEAQWLTVRSMQILAKDDPRYANEAFNAMDVLVRSFPDSKYVRRVEFEKLLMEISKFPPAEAIRRLQNIQADDPNHVEAVFQRLKLQHRVWQENQKQDSPRLRLSLDQLLEAELVFHQLQPSPPHGQRIKAALLSVDALIRSGEPQAAAKRIAVAEELVQQHLAPTSSLSAELHYEYFRLARSEGSLPGMKQQADWFYGKMRDSSYSQAVLVALTQDLQQAREASPESFDFSVLVESYERLVNLLGSSRAQLIASKNARVASLRLLEVYYETQQYEKAGTLAAKLLEAFPNRRDCLLWTARVKTKREDLEAALGYWRTLVKAVEPGSDDWFEAKLGVIECLAAEDVDAAGAVLKQTLSLTGDIPSQWQDRFDRLAEKTQPDPSGDGS